MRLRTVVFYIIITIIFISTLAFDYIDRKKEEEDLINTMGPPPVLSSQAPDFQILNETGEIISSNDMQGKSYLMIFWTVDCPFGSDLIIEIDDTLKKENVRNLEIIPVNISDTLKDIQAFYKQNNIDLSIYMDYEKVTKWAFNVNAIPTAYMINANEKITSRQIGIGKKSLEHIKNKLVQ